MYFHGCDRRLRGLWLRVTKFVLRGVLCGKVCARTPGWVPLGLWGESDILGSGGKGVVVDGVFLVKVVEVLGGC